MQDSVLCNNVEHVSVSLFLSVFVFVLGFVFLLVVAVAGQCPW